MPTTSSGRGAPTKKRSLLVFVPGFMGSALVYSGQGPLGDPIEEEIWGPDVSIMLAERNLDRLIYPTPAAATVAAPYIIERVSLYGLPWFGPDVYGTILHHLRQPRTEAAGVTLLEFPYDWRSSIWDMARALAERIELARQNLRLSSVVIVSHSMGGLVSRLALLASKPLRARVRRVIHIASPLHGSIKAFWTLKVRPSMNGDLDHLLRRVLGVADYGRVVAGKTTLSNKLMQVVSTFPALYELLPPQHIQSLTSDIGTLFSCVDPQLWHPNLHGLVDQGRQTHARLATAYKIDVPVFVIYSGSLLTDHTYRVKPDQPYALEVERAANVWGDSTVTVHSATYGTPDKSRYLERRRPNGHVALCRNKTVLETLDRYVFS